MSRPEEARKWEWLARGAVGLVFVVNVACALAFILRPGDYAPSFELPGLAGKIAVQGFGILFLMWNATYPLVIFQPGKNRLLFAVVLIQQFIGVLGESWLWLSLPAGHPALQVSGLRFIQFDGFGLLLMGAAYCFLPHSGSEKPD